MAAMESVSLVEEAIQKVVSSETGFALGFRLVLPK
jgi:hypothetical protein